MKTKDMVEKVETITDRARDWAETAREQAREAVETTGDYIRGNVWTSVAVAVSVGAILGFLLSRGRSD